MLMFWLKCNDVYETAGADPRFSDGGGGGGGGSDKGQPTLSNCY